jgi:homoserine O-succinyltransferase
MRFARGEREDYPPFVENYFSLQVQGILAEHEERVRAALARGAPVPDLPEHLIAPTLHNTWHDTAEAVVNNWIGKVYQLTNRDRRVPFMEGVDPEDPLGLRGAI